MASSAVDTNASARTSWRPTPLSALALAAGLPVAFFVWMLLSPVRVVSREMTWDMLFIVSGAWHVFQGHVAHVDFHDPAGQLNFLLTAAGFYLVGPTPQAFLVGSSLMALALFAGACVAAARRLSLLPATLFVVFASLLALMPANAGDLPSAYSFAMSYNRYGWSALSIVALILFLPTRTGDDGGIVDQLIAGLLLLALFYLKVTYFAGGLAALAFAVVTCPAVRRRWRSWTALGVLLVANALAPYSHPYLADLWANTAAGGVKNNYVLQFNYFLSNATEHAAYIALVATAGWLWRRGEVALSVPLAAAFLVGMGWLLLSQNSQFNGVPLPVVAALLLYEALHRRRFGALPLVLLILPTMWIAASAASVAGHYFKTRDPGLTVVERTNLKGLAVPTEQDGLLADFAEGTHADQLLSRARVNRPRHELSPYEYTQTILEAASLFSNLGLRPGPVVLLDQVNPMPFVLGWPPPRGGNLWSGPRIPLQPAAQVFAGVDYVLIPKFSTIGAWTLAAATTYYGHYLSDHFHQLEESRSWYLLGLEAGAARVPNHH
jgi:hypothetical protein